MITIRAEAQKDARDVHAINRLAFGGPEEARLVDRLRGQVEPLVSLVLETDGRLIGHILFSPVELAQHANLLIMGLGPMAVLPEMQRQGFGRALVRKGLDECRRLGAGAVVVLGHPEYYSQFGFQNASKFGITSEFDVPDEVFMALELVPGYLEDAAGTARYAPVFSDL